MLGGHSRAERAAGREQRGHLSVSRAAHRTHPPEARPGGPHPKSVFLSPVQPPGCPIVGVLSIVSSPNIGSQRRDPHDKAVNTSRERTLTSPETLKGDSRRGHQSGY